MSSSSSSYVKNKFTFLAISFNLGISSISTLATNYLFMNKFQTTPHIRSYIQTISNIPWYIKPVFGLITDFLPICGYRRKVYIILMGLLQCLCLMLLKYMCYTVYHAVVLFFLVNVSLSFSSIISQAIFVELSKQQDGDEGKQELKSLNSLYTFYKYIGILIASMLKGVLVEMFTLEDVFIISSFIPIVVIIAGFVFEEKRMNTSSSQTNDKLISNSIHTSNANSNCKQIFNYITEIRIIIIIVFIVLLTALPPSYEHPLFYYNDEISKFKPNDFAIINLLSTVLSLIIIYLYKQYLYSLSFKTTVTIGRGVFLLCMFAHYMVIKGYNVDYISDYLIFVISGPIGVAARELSLLPVQVLAGLLCPENMEGTVYAVFMSGINVGEGLGNIVGSVMMGKLDIKKGCFGKFGLLLEILMMLGSVPIVVLGCIKKDVLEGNDKKKGKKGKNDDDIELQEKNDE